MVVMAKVGEMGQCQLKFLFGSLGLVHVNFLIFFRGEGRLDGGERELSITMRMFQQRLWEAERMVSLLKSR